MADQSTIAFRDLSPEALEKYIYFNGLDGATGEYLTPKLERAQLGAGVRLEREERGEPELSKSELEELRARGAPVEAHRGTEAEEPENLAQAGWGVIFAADDPQTPAILDALGPLLGRRRQEADGEPQYQEYTAERGYVQGETAHQFLVRHGVGPGPAVPGMVPYYLLIVGDPARIPFEFQCGLDVQYAVGRLHFGDLDEYRRYAEGVVAAEDGAITRDPRLVFFGVRNPGDGATQLGTMHLTQPLVDEIKQRVADQELPWQVDLVPVLEAKKPRLLQLLGGDQTPALLFTASHGAIFPPGDHQRISGLGALVTGEWMRLPGQPAPLTPDVLVRAEDIDGGRDLGGLIAFHFACFGVGMPQRDYYEHLGSPSKVPIGPQPLLAPLPQRLLGRGALAVIGHVDRALPSSFYWAEAVQQKRQLAVFRSALWLLMKGHRVGFALEHFNMRYAQLATMINEALDTRLRWKEVEINPDTDKELANLWLANNDARSYVIMGDPAVRPAVAAAADETRGAAAAPAESDLPSVRFRRKIGVARTFVAPAPAATRSASRVEPRAMAAPSFAAGDALAPTTKAVTAQETLADGLEAGGIQISTWAVDDVAAPQARVLKARTHISANGEVDTYLPNDLAATDEIYLQAHRAMVGEALAARPSLIDMPEPVEAS